MFITVTVPTVINYRIPCHFYIAHTSKSVRQKQKTALALSVHSPDEVLAMAAESRLLEESSGELVIAYINHVFETQSTSTLVPRWQRRTLVAVLPSRVGQATSRVAADSGVHCPL